MSHFTKIKTKLYNLEILKRSLNDLELETELASKQIEDINNNFMMLSWLLSSQITMILGLLGTVMSTN